MTPLDAIWDRLLIREGGVVKHPTEAFRTFFGQTEPWLATFDLPRPQDAGEAKANYERWAKLVRLDALVAPGDALAEQILDFAVHSGEGVVVRALQRLLGLSADGLVGPKTVKAVQMAPSRDLLARQLLAYRMRLVTKLLAREKNRIYLGGWLNRLAEMVERL